MNITRPGDGVSLAGVNKGDNKATLSLKAQALSKEANDAAKKAEELRALNQPRTRMPRLKPISNLR